MSREFINEENLEQVVGGLMNFNYNTKILTYTHEETGAKTKYQIVDFEQAWKLSNQLHGQGLHEDKIMAQLKAKGYIK